MTAKPNDAPYDQLEKMFHEPNRLAIMSALCAEREGLTFTELKETCGLTDGNLNRHLRVLEESGAVRIDKRFVDSKPRTTVYITKPGLARFQEYLEALSAVLEQARKALPAEARGVSVAAATRLAHA
jgi:DNA-binding transcriptional ArsR family regulator